MGKYNIYYHKEYDVCINDKLQHFKESGKTEIEADSTEEAKDTFYEMFDKRADVLCCQMNMAVVIDDVVEQAEAEQGWSDETKQNILKDFLKKC